MKLNLTIKYTNGEVETYTAGLPEWAKWERKTGKSIYKMTDIKEYQQTDFLFLARLDDVIVFNKISKNEFCKIFDRMIEKTNEMLKQNNKTIEISEETKDFLLKKIEENGNNARSIQKVYRQYFEIPLAKFMLKDSKSEIHAKFIDSTVMFE